jgi:hypothetical protein
MTDEDTEARELLYVRGLAYKMSNPLGVRISCPAACSAMQ